MSERRETEMKEKRDTGALLDEDALKDVAGEGCPKPAYPAGKRFVTICPVCQGKIDVEITEGWTTTCACGAKIVCHGGGFTAR